MSATATSPARPHTGAEHRALGRREAGCRPEPGRATLDDRMSALWTQLVETGTADCPVCGGEIAAARPCGSCGSELT
jgi:hypothetical protein